MMPRIRYTVLLAIVASVSGAQTPSAVTNVAQSHYDDATLRKMQGLMSPGNPWINWAVSAEANIKSLAGDGSFSQQWLLMASKITYEIPLDATNFHLAVMANLAAVQSALGNGSKKDSITAGIQSLTSSTDGLNVGLFPYYEFPPLPSFQTSIYGFAAAKLNSFKDTVAKADKSLLAGRFGGGIEFRVGKLGGDAKPLTLSLTAVHSRFGADAYQAVFKERREQINSVELTAILPLSTSAGLLLETVGMDQAKPAIRLGIMVGASKAPAKAKANDAIVRSEDGVCSTSGCVVEVVGDESLVGSATVSDEKSIATPTPNPCVIKAGGTCNFVVGKGATVRLAVGDGFVLESSDGMRSKTKDFTPSGQIRLSVKNQK